jgi:hypothetical protein
MDRGYRLAEEWRDRYVLSVFNRLSQSLTSTFQTSSSKLTCLSSHISQSSPSFISLPSASQNQMALHTGDTCSAPQGGASLMSGKTTQTNCNTTVGCTVLDSNLKSFGQGFNDAGGGVYATKFDHDGVL